MPSISQQQDLNICTSLQHFKPRKHFNTKHLKILRNLPCHVKRAVGTPLLLKQQDVENVVVTTFLECHMVLLLTEYCLEI